jgi:hypothetical protein
MKVKPMLKTPELPSKADTRLTQLVVVKIEKQARGSLIVSVCSANGGEDYPAQSVPPAALQLELTLLGLPLRQAHELAERALSGEVETYPLNVSYEKWQEICSTWLWRARPGIPFGTAGEELTAGQ